MHTVDIYRGNLFLFSLKPENDSVQVKKIMGENEIRINTTENQYIDLKIGDHATVFDEIYYLNTEPVVTKKASNKYEYQIVLQSEKDTIAKVQYMFLGDDNSLKESVFSLTGTAADFVNLLIRNLSRLLPSFEFSTGSIITTDFKTLSFDGTKCLDALAKIAEAFETEFWVTGTVISLYKKGNDTGYVFKHGKRKGLYELIRKNVDNSNVVTRLYAFGSDKNLPENYRNFSRRLKLPGQPSKTVTNLTWSIIDDGSSKTYTFTFDPPEIPDVTGITVLFRPNGSSGNFYGNLFYPNTSPIVVNILDTNDFDFVFRTELTTGQGESTLPVYTTPGSPQPLFTQSGDIIAIEKNINIYGLSEGVVIMDDVFPHRTGTVTSVDAGNFYRFHDADIDFDVNDYLLPGMTAKVTFNTGQLSGYTFDISAFDNGAKRFTILQNKNERAFDIPNFDLKPAIGDKYVLTDIKMPETYIEAAESELLLKAEILLDKISEPLRAYQLIIDPVYLAEKNYNINIGDLVWIIDSAMMVQRKMRVTATKRNIINKFDYSIEIADELSESKIQALTSGQGILNDSVSNINTNLQNNSILNNRVVGDLIITGQSSIKFEDLQTGSGLTAIGVDSNGRIFKM